MAGFTTCDSIKVLTQNGECEIELCLGDITKLEKKDKVDVLMVSAFLGDYAPTPTSVIGALQRNLDISVRDLARDKEEDLRQLYSCWWSKPLPDHLPYKRLLCFETKSLSSSPPQVMISDAFRCLVPILNNKDGTVITPLLNTGDQGYGKDVMIKGMVEAAVRWMKAGLPLRKLKIVLFARRIEGDAKEAAKSSGYGLTLAAFEKMKEKYDMQYMMPKEVKLEFDVYLSYSEADSDVVQEILEKLKRNKEDVRIFSTRQQLDQNVFWQEDMYDAMMKSARVITVLTPNYLQTTACLEQYNIALCCNRKAHHDMLAPFYAATIENMPTYMGLVQYVDCRSQDVELINSACYQVITSLSIAITRGLSAMNASVVQYDLFLSYSHKDSETALKIVKMLQDLNPKLKVFFDVEELKTGKSWQRALYHSIDGSRCLVALMTNNYIRSAVCQEEFNLATMKHYALTNRLQLIAFVIEEMSHLPPGFEKVPKITSNSDTHEDNIKTLCSSLVLWLEKGVISEKDSSYHTYFNIAENLKFDISKKWEMLRRKLFEERFYNSQNVLENFPPAVTNAFKKGNTPADDNCDIVLTYNDHDEKYAEFLMDLLQHFSPKLNIQAKGKNEQERLTRIEGGKKIVPLLSPSYIESPEQVEELHIAIWRSRLVPNLIFPIHLHILPPRPAYFHLLPCPVNLNDALWTELALKERVVLPREVEKVVKGLGKPSEEIALFMAVYHLLETIEKERQEPPPPPSSSKPALLNPFCLDGNTKDLGSDEGGQVIDTNTNHPEVADGDMKYTSEETSNAAVDKPETEASDTNKPHTETDISAEVTGNAAEEDLDGKVDETTEQTREADITSGVTGDAAIDKPEAEASDTNKPHTETDISAEVTGNAAEEDLDGKVDETTEQTREADITTGVTGDAAIDKPEVEASDTNTKPHTETDISAEVTGNAAEEDLDGKVDETTEQTREADITSGVTGDAAIDKPEAEASDTNKPHTETDISAEVTGNAAEEDLDGKVDETTEQTREADITSGVTGDAAIDKPEAEASDTNKPHIETDSSAEVTGNAADEDLYSKVDETMARTMEADITSGITGDAAMDKPEVEASDTNKPHTETHVTAEEVTGNAAEEKQEVEGDGTIKPHTETDTSVEVTGNAAIDKQESTMYDTNQQHIEVEIVQEEKKDCTRDEKGDSPQDAVVKKDDNETLELSSGQKISDEHRESKRRSSASSEQKTAGGRERRKSFAKRWKRRLCTLI